MIIYGSAEPVSDLDPPALLDGSYSGTDPYGLYVNADLTATGGTTAVQMRVAGSIATEDDTVTYPFISTLELREPVITKGASDTITEATTLRINGAPTEGVANYALHVVSGASLFGGALTVQGAFTSDANTIIDTTSTEALLVRQNADAQDVFAVDTTNQIVKVKSAAGANAQLQVYRGGSTGILLTGGAGSGVSAVTAYNTVGLEIKCDYSGGGNYIKFTTDDGEIARFYRGGNVRFGTSGTPSAKVHIISTTEQQRLGYDASNYLSTTVSSAGAVTFDAVGASASFILNDSVKCVGAFGMANVTPQAQQAHIIDADGTLEDITTKFNTLLADLEGFGFLATS